MVITMNLFLWIGALLIAGSLLTWATTGVSGMSEGSLRMLPRMLLVLGLLSLLLGLGKRLMVI